MIFEEISIPGRWCVAAAAATAIGILVPMPLAVVSGVVVLIGGRRWLGRGSLAVLTALILCGSVANGVAESRSRAELTGEIPIRRIVLTARLTEDPSPSRGSLAVAEPLRIGAQDWFGPRLAIGPFPAEFDANDTAVVSGTLRDGTRRMGNDVVAGTFDVDELIARAPSANPLFVVGNAIRDRVRNTFDEGTPADGLVRGLVMGDTGGIPVRSLEDLRRSGLAHFVAVSGSNVALFLMIWWIVGMPFAIHPRMRAAFGFIGLAVFVIVTRWEPSVVRASVMAAVPLAGGLVSVPVDPWMALGTAVTLLLLLSADLIGSVGFLLSVFATAGVLVGVSVTRSRTPRWLWTPLGATIGAQVAVAPIILVVFGTIPLLAPVANLVAAPVVAGTTLAGFVAVIVPLPVIAEVTRFGADVVLQISERAAGGPQLSAAATAGVALVGVLTAVRTMRPIGVAATLIATGVLASGAPSWPTTPSVVVLDVGQGDAILVQDPSGFAMLVDGGGNPGVLDRALRRHGVTRLNTVVVTHGDADHVGGLVGLAGSIDIGSLWLGAFNDHSVLTEKVIEEAERSSVPIRMVQTGDRGSLGSVGIEVLGPQRRYLSENDGSVVLLLTGERTMLLPGDIESIGQADLPAVRPDALLIPHHGSATTSIRWLDKTVGDIAVVSYGVNSYGHPHPDVLASLEVSGARVLQTFFDGDIRIPLG